MKSTHHDLGRQVSDKPASQVVLSHLNRHPSSKAPFHLSQAVSPNQPSISSRSNPQIHPYILQYGDSNLSSVLRSAIEVGVVIGLCHTASAGQTRTHVDHGGTVETDLVALGGGGDAFLEPDVVEAAKGHLLALGVEEILNNPVGVCTAEGWAAVEDESEGVILVEIGDLTVTVVSTRVIISPSATWFHGVDRLHMKRKGQQTLHR